MERAAVRTGGQGMGGADRALATEIVYGTARRQGTLDYYLQHVVSRPWAKLDPRLLQILRAGAYELLYLDRVPARAAIHQAVELAKTELSAGAAGFANGVLRTLQRQRSAIPLPSAADDPEGYLAVVHSHPRFLVRRYLQQFSFAEAETLCIANNRVPDLTVRVNRLRSEPAVAAAGLAQAGVTTVPGRWLPEALRLAGTAGQTPAGLPGFQAGDFTFQDEASMLVARVVDPQPGDYVLDACSAPGTKAGHLAELMGDRGRVAAADIDARRLARVAAGSRRLGLNSVTTHRLDARDGTALAALVDGGFDRVLVDAPCSGLGTLARRPDLRWQKDEADIKALASLQTAILAGAATAVKPGGVLVYSTCTTTKEENFDVVAGFLMARPDFAPAALAPCLPAALAADAVDHQLMLWPHRHGTDGFFIARLRRRA